MNDILKDIPPPVNWGAWMCRKCGKFSKEQKHDCETKVVKMNQDERENTSVDEGIITNEILFRFPDSDAVHKQEIFDLVWKYARSAPSGDLFAEAVSCLRDYVDEGDDAGRCFKLIRKVDAVLKKFKAMKGENEKAT